jgi:hypothetical protein
MAWFKDLSPCSYFGDECKSFLQSVGWLERDKSFATGPVDADVYARLVEFIKDPWQPRMFMGPHGCDLCQYESESSGFKNVFIPGNGTVFVCPELIVHYMNAHWYQPPKEFC